MCVGKLVLTLPEGVKIWRYVHLLRHVTIPALDGKHHRILPAGAR